MTAYGSYSDVLKWHFNSHAHVERDAVNANTVKNLAISTHTLTWSVTFITPF